MKIHDLAETPIGAGKTAIVDESDQTNYALWIDFANIADGDEFVYTITIKLSDTIQSVYYNRKVDHKKITKHGEPLVYLPPTPCKGFKVEIQKTRDTQNDTIQQTIIRHQLITSG